MTETNDGPEHRGGSSDGAPPGADTQRTSRPHLTPKVPPPVGRTGDGAPTRPAGPEGTGSGDDGPGGGGTGGGRRRRRSRGSGRGGGGGRGETGGDGRGERSRDTSAGADAGQDGSGRRRRRRRGRGGSGSGGGGGAATPVESVVAGGEAVELDAEQLAQRRGRVRKGRPVGRYTMAVHRHDDGLTHIAVLEGRNLIEHHVSRPSDQVGQIHGNVYLGRVQNVLPGMEAAFVDIGTPKNAVLYRSDVSFDPDDVERKGREKPRIEQVLRAGQTVLCQVTKNPIAHKGARLTMEVSLPGRFVVLVPDSDTYGISKRLPDPERKRLRKVLDRVKPDQHGVIVRTASENVTAEEIEVDVKRLLDQWGRIGDLARSSRTPALLYTEPDMALRIIREEFNKDFRAVVIDDPDLFDQVEGYLQAVTPALAERVELHDPDEQGVDLFERFHVTEQLVKAIDRKVWLPSGGSLIIEHTEALTVIDVNTGKNVGSRSLEDTVFANNLEAAEEIAKQLRLRDIGGIIVIDFVDMEVKKNREEVLRVFKENLARDKTRTQVFAISELGLVEMTRKRIGEGLLESMSEVCDRCSGRGVILSVQVPGR